MTKMAIYEQGKGKKQLPICQYFRKDYVSLQMIKMFVYSTLAFGILFALTILYDLDNWMEKFAKLNYIKFGTSVVICYLIYEVVFQLIAVIVFNRSYTKARKGAKQYLGKLKKVEKLYAQEENMNFADEKQR
jgi:hypothetical protein